MFNELFFTEIKRCENEKMKKRIVEKGMSNKDINNAISHTQKEIELYNLIDTDIALYNQKKVEKGDCTEFTSTLLMPHVFFFEFKFDLISISKIIFIYHLFFSFIFLYIRTGTFIFFEYKSKRKRKK